MATAESLKSKNRPYLVAWTLAHSLTAAWVVAGTPLRWHALIVMDGAAWTRSLGMLVAAIVVMLLNGLASRRLKAVLVFWTLRHPDPSHRAFSELAKTDPRIDLDGLRHALDRELPVAPPDQNTAWMQLYNEHEAAPAVRTNHGEYLLFRDLVWLSLITTALSGVGSLLLTSASKASVVYLLASLCFVLLFTLVARNHGHRFVCTVMSCAAAKHSARRQGEM